MVTRRAAARPRVRVLRWLVVVLGLAGFVVAVYVVVVLGGGVVLGREGTPSILLAVVATTAVALLFAPVQSGLEKAADRWGLRAPATPYDVLSRFSAAADVGDAAAELPTRMSRLLVEGTGALWAQVWLQVAGRLSLVATWPPGARADDSLPLVDLDGGDTGDLGRRVEVVRHGQELLGVLRLQERPDAALTAVEERLFGGLAAQAGLMLRLTVLRAELQERQEQLAARVQELQASRQRLVQAHDIERRRLERDIHDGAQQHLVALTVNMRLVQSIAVRSPERALSLLAEQAGAAHLAVETISSLSRGIYPRLLVDEGLVPALRLAARTSALPVTIDTETTERLPAAVEAAFYFLCIEAVQNAAKHANALGVVVHVTGRSHSWCVSVADDGSGFDVADATAAPTGAGLVNMRDRIDAVGGTVTVESVPGQGTVITAAVPRTGPHGALVPPVAAASRTVRGA